MNKKPEPALGQAVRYTKTHEGHLCVVTGLVRNDKNQLVKVAVWCECLSELLLNPQDYEVLSAYGN